MRQTVFKSHPVMSSRGFGADPQRLISLRYWLKPRLRKRDASSHSPWEADRKQGMKVGNVYQKGRQTCARVSNLTVHGEIPVTVACNHRSIDVVDMWEAEVEQRQGGEKGVDELVRGIKGSFITRESETQQENTAAWQLKFTVRRQLHSPGSWLGKLL